MKKFTQSVLASLITVLVFAMPAQSEDVPKSLKQAQKATKLRQSVFQLMGSNMGPLGAMAKGKMAMNLELVEKNALRINQLSLMIADYARPNTSSFEVKTEAKPDVWTKPEQFAKNIEKLTQASDNLLQVVKTKDEAAVKSAIGDMAKTCGGCHDDYKQKD